MKIRFKNNSCFLSGLHTKPLKMTFEKFHIFGIQMKPVAVKALPGMPPCGIKHYWCGTLGGIGDRYLASTCQRSNEKLLHPLFEILDENKILEAV